MKTSDLLASRILTVALSISIILCSLSLLIFSINHVNTAKADNIVTNGKQQDKMPWDDNLKGAVSLGIVNNTGYFVIWGSPSNMLYKVDLAKARDWYAD